MKKILALLTLLTVLFTYIPSFAEAPTKNITIMDISKNTIKLNEQSQIDKQMELISRSSTNITSDFSTRSIPDYEYKNELVATATASKVAIGYAYNQPSGGTVFSSPGGFNWQDGGSSVSLSVSVSLAYGPVSISVSASPGNVSTTGYYISSPWTNTPCKLFIYKDFEVKQYKVYRKPIMGSGSWEYVRTFETSTPTRNYFEVKKVN